MITPRRIQCHNCKEDKPIIYGWKRLIEDGEIIIVCPDCVIKERIPKAKFFTEAPDYTLGQIVKRWIKKNQNLLDNPA